MKNFKTKKEFEGKVFLITGGTGSFGKKCVELLLKEYHPKVIRVYSRDELKQHNMDMEFKSEKIRYFIGDVRDRKRLARALKDVDYVIHAAALKQVPACEYNPIEAVKTNIQGTINVIETSIDLNIDKVICLSTDKAATPVNLYGATKLVAEKLIIQSNSYVGTGNTKLGVVRYGNVIGSRGSVIPIFKKQALEGQFTITHKDMTRFWITQSQAVHFILNCLRDMKGGEIFVPKLPSMKIMDLTKILNPKAKIKFIGIRPGEKIHETLLTEMESYHALEFDDYFIIEPEHPFWKEKKIKGGKGLPSDFTYDSKNNKWWLKTDELKKIVNELKDSE
ncbi:MAG TPA: UDP-N-acetylglucosamine 4,6-dehydratase (inverting) [Firmicutes bacterium]|nr:UDP-N-acetylglucosamine 4,6-dehydratase (inverting) [Bacillota bacterium]